jgi:sphingosine-1-phosphate phosphatase 1
MPLGGARLALRRAAPPTNQPPAPTNQPTALKYPAAGDVEDGVPSAHCCGAVSLLFYCINAAAAAGALPVPKAAAQAAAVAWTAWLAWGRAYLGLHTPLDLATGSLLGWALIDLWALVEQLYTAWLHASLAPQTPAWQLPAQVLLCSFVLMRCYPMPRRWTSCYNYATAWQAGWAGTTVGWALRNAGGGAAAGSAATAAAGGWELSSITAAGVLKVLLGLGMIVLAKVTAKAVLLALLRRTFALVPLRIRCLWQPPVFGAVLRQAGKQQPQQLKGTAGAGEQQCSSSSGGAAAAKQQPAGKRQQPSSSGSIWGLRHSFDGTPNDVVATARWGSYFAVGIIISMWQAWYPALLQASGAFAASSSVS